MARETEAPPRSLYEEDETAWLELTADLIAKKRFEDVDQPAALSACPYTLERLLAFDVNSQ
jgi:hypothetical protein